MKKKHISSFEFDLKYKDTGKSVNIDELLEEEWAHALIYCDIDGFYWGSGGLLILADECGNYAYVPREERFLITVFIGSDIYEMIY